MSGFLDGALRAHADGDLCAEAAAGLLIAGRWLDRDDFAGRVVTVAAGPGSGTQMAVIDWPAAAGALGAGTVVALYHPTSNASAAPAPTSTRISPRRTRKPRPMRLAMAEPICA